jgi:RNA polymerase sigma-70 factor, ECF subfamily
VPDVATTPLDVGELYRKHAGVVLRRIRKFYSANTAEEVLHEVFERALNRAHTFRGESHPVTWLYQLTTYHCLNRLRDERRRRELFDGVGEVPWSRTISEPTGEARIFLDQLWRDVDDELCQIGVYYYVDGMSQAEIGELMSVSGRTISTRLTQLTALAHAAAGHTPEQP